jgi:hypothetical protein
MKKPNYIPKKCEHCGQPETYLLAIDAGTVHIVKQLSRFIGKKGINAVHPRKEMEGTYLTSNEVGNLTRPRAHGLIASIRGEPGNYCLTTKGSEFLHGRIIPKYAIRSMIEGKTIGYLEPEIYTTHIAEYDVPGAYWEGINYEIQEGRIIKNVEQTLW